MQKGFSTNYAPLEAYVMPGEYQDAVQALEKAQQAHQMIGALLPQMQLDLCLHYAQQMAEAYRELQLMAIRRSSYNAGFQEAARGSEVLSQLMGELPSPVILFPRKVR